MTKEEWNNVENKELINSYSWEITEWLMDPSKCDTCEFRKSDKRKVKVSWTSTEL